MYGVTVYRYRFTVTIPGLSGGRLIRFGKKKFTRRDHATSKTAQLSGMCVVN